MHTKFWREPVQLELPFPPHGLSNVVDLSRRKQHISAIDVVGFKSFDPIQLELPFPYPDSPRVLDFFAGVRKFSKAGCPRGFMIGRRTYGVFVAE